MSALAGAAIGTGLGVLALGTVFRLFKDAPRLMGDTRGGDSSQRYFTERVRISVRWARALQMCGVGLVVLGGVVALVVAIA